MQLKSVVSTFLSTLTALCVGVLTASSAQATNLVSGVALGGSLKGSSVFLNTDPVYNTYPTYLINSLKPGRFGSGVNLPALNNGFVPDVGRFQEFLIYYAVPQSGPSADPGLNVRIQTSDGFTRIANVNSTAYDSGNGFNVYQIDLLPGDFSPSFSPNQTVLRTASVRYNGSIGSLYTFFPAIAGENGIIEATDFSYKTSPDQNFNNGL